MKIYFIGICGIGMSSLAKFLSLKGFTILGNDKNYSKNCELFKGFNIKIYKHENLKRIEESDVIVYTSAINSNNKGLVYAKELEKAIYSRAKLLNEIINSFSNSIGIAGSHGKTTTISMLTHVLFNNDISFTSFIGGEDVKFSNLYSDKNKQNVLSEICEYNKNLRNITTKISAILNIDSDHLDTYLTMENLENEFFNYATKSELVILNNDDKRLKNFKNLTKKITFSINEDSDYKAEKIKIKNGKISFIIKNGDYKSKKIKLNAHGKHNVYNALCAIVIAREVFFISFEKIISGLNTFNGVKRRFEEIGNLYNFKVIADYCHHPSEIKSTLEIADTLYKKDYLAVFEPHTYSRTKLLFNDFISVFKGRNIVLYKEFASREKYDYFGSSKHLSKSVKTSIYIDNFEELLKLLKETNNIKHLLILGAGDLYGKIKSQLES